MELQIANISALKPARLSKKMGLRKMSEKIGISTTFLFNIENGAHEIPVKRIADFEREYGIKLDRKPTYEELTAENERLLRVVEQATKEMSADEYGGIWIKAGTGQYMQVGSRTADPDLYAQLKGADRG